MTANTVSSALIIDDNYFNRDLAALALRHNGYKVEQAENGREALEILHKTPFNLLVLDLAMPEMDGAAFLRRLRADLPELKLFIIVMTANPHMATQEIQSQVDFVMYKPIDVSEFSQFVGRLSDVFRANSATAAAR
jgi:CheY-like chemotaxis protein